MDAASRLAALQAALDPIPNGSTIPVAFVRRLLGDENGDAPTSTGDLLTVEDVARILTRSASTARSLLASGRIAGFRLNDREWRCSRADVQAYLDAERERQTRARRVEPAAPRSRKRKRLDAWRKVAEVES